MPRSIQPGRFQIRPSERRILDAGIAVPLGARAVDLLLALTEHRDRVVTKRELLELAWPGSTIDCRAGVRHHGVWLRFLADLCRAAAALACRGAGRDCLRQRRSAAGADARRRYSDQHCDVDRRSGESRGLPNLMQMLLAV